MPVLTVMMPALLTLPEKVETVPLTPMPKPFAAEIVPALVIPPKKLAAFST
ncbi:MAG: hypothetical protein WBF27_03985 [Xanthobacteraceae bacterium]